jgi:hypothetical protein
VWGRDPWRGGDPNIDGGGVRRIFAVVDGCRRITYGRKPPHGVKSLDGAEPPRWDGGPNSDGEAFVGRV